MRKDQARDWHGRFVKEHKDPEELKIYVEDPVIDVGVFFTCTNSKPIEDNSENDKGRLTCGEGLTYMPEGCALTKEDIEDAWEAFDERHDKDFIACLAVIVLVIIGFFGLLALLAIFRGV